MNNFNTFKKKALLKSIYFFTSVVMIIFSTTAFSQGGIINNGVFITLKSGAYISAAGPGAHFTNNTSAGIDGKIDNDGSIKLEGDWINNANSGNVFTNLNGTGKVIFTGSNAQSIGGTAFTVFENVVLEKTGNGVSLNTDAEVASSINLTDDFVEFNTNELRVLNPSPDAIISTTGYVVSEQTDNSGKLTWTMNNNTGTYVFPFGTSGGTNIPFTFNLISGNAGNVTASTYGTTPDNLPWPIAPDQVTNLDSKIGLLPDNRDATVDRFWQIDPSGSAKADLTFTYTPTEVPVAPYNDVNSIVAQRYDAVTDKWQEPSEGQISGAHFVTVPGVTEFSPWTLANNQSPLPVELIFFEATPVNKKVNLAWATASEKNNDFFTVERSQNAVDFEEIGTVQGAGNSNVVMNYGLTDHDPYSGISYYRLNQTGFDKKVTYSDIIAVNLDAEQQKAFAIYPNPTGGDVYLRTGDFLADNLTVQITDVIGKIVFDVNISGEDYISGKQLLITNQLTKGIYVIRIFSGNDTFIQKLIVQ